MWFSRFVLLFTLVIVLAEVQGAPRPLTQGIKKSTGDFVGDLLESLSHYVRDVISGSTAVLKNVDPLPTTRIEGSLKVAKKNKHPVEIEKNLDILS